MCIRYNIYELFSCNSQRIAYMTLHYVYMYFKSENYRKQSYYHSYIQDFYYTKSATDSYFFFVAFIWINLDFHGNMKMHAYFFSAV